MTQALAGSQWQGRGSTDEEHSSSSRSPKSEPKQSGSSRTPSSVSESPAPSGGDGERAVSPVERSRTAPPPGSSPKPKPLALRLNEAVVLRRKGAINKKSSFIIVISRLSQCSHCQYHSSVGRQRDARSLRRHESAARLERSFAQTNDVHSSNQMLCLLENSRRSHQTGLQVLR